MKKQKRQRNPLPFLAGAVIIAAVAVTLLYKVVGDNNSASSESVPLVDSSDLEKTAVQIGQ